MRAALLWILACGGPAKESVGPADSGTSSVDSDPCAGTPTVTTMGIRCVSPVCSWYVETDRPAASIRMEADQTGDPKGSCGPQKGGVNRCGEWMETVDSFTQTGTVGTCGRHYEAALDVVDDVSLQIDDQTTLFDTSEELGELTILVVLDEGAACAVTGQQDSYFLDVCATHI
jgi:hypothetical protein